MVVIAVAGLGEQVAGAVGVVAVDLVEAVEPNLVPTGEVGVEAAHRADGDAPAEQGVDEQVLIDGAVGRFPNQDVGGGIVGVHPGHFPGAGLSRERR